MKVKTACLLCSLMRDNLRYKNMQDKENQKKWGGGAKRMEYKNHRRESKYINHFYCLSLGSSKKSYLMVI